MKTNTSSTHNAAQDTPATNIIQLDLAVVRTATRKRKPPLPRAVETQSFAAHEDSLGQGEGHFRFVGNESEGMHERAGREAERAGQGASQTGTSQVQCLSLPLDFNRKSQIRNRKLNRRHQVARSRAAWWFGQMRKAVNAAVEWKPAPVARPEQTYITLNTGR
jgi:hypothetical protein